VTSSEHTGREAEIRARWNATTPGPWHVTVFDDVHAMNLVAVATVADTDASSEIIAATLVQAPRYVDVADGRWDENAEAIANAPSDIAYLLGQNALLEGQLAMAREIHKPETRYTPDDGETSYDTYADAAEISKITDIAPTQFEVCEHCGSIEMDAGATEYRDSLWPCDTARALGLGEGATGE
jgi:hypothetical protein